MTLLRISLSRLSTLVGMTALLLVMPAVVAAQERIAYTSTANNNTDVWSMKTDGSDQRQLTANSSVDNDPSFSPDGGRIAFVSSRDGNSEIYVMNADGTDQKRLTSNTVTDMDPTWSPDGSKIVFVSFRDAVSVTVHPRMSSELRVDFVAMQRIQIVWVDNSDNEDGFIIEGCAQRGCNNFIELGRVFPNIRHFVHGNLYPNTQYYYRIRSFNAGGMSAYTDVVSAKTLKK